MAATKNLASCHIKNHATYRQFNVSVADKSFKIVCRFQTSELDLRKAKFNNCFIMQLTQFDPPILISDISDGKIKY